MYFDNSLISESLRELRFIDKAIENNSITVNNFFINSLRKMLTDVLKA